MIEIGRLCIKTAGRDAGLKCIIVDILDDKYVLIDGEARRRKCNILHLEPLKDLIKIGKNAGHDEITSALKELGLVARDTKPKQKTTRPIKVRKSPEQLKTQKEEKKKLRDVFKKKAKTDAKKGKEASTLEEKAGLVEDDKKDSVKNEKDKSKSKTKKIPNSKKES